MSLNQCIECIPNISEGRDAKVIQDLSLLLKKGKGIELLGVESGADVNRSVFTFIGSPEDVMQVVFEMYRFVSDMLNMRRQRGVHPRLGMVDVCPFVPVTNISVRELNKMVWDLGKRVGYGLDIPVYFYEYSAWAPYQKSLESIRKGEYELLTEKYYTGAAIPDVGPVQFNFKTGATVMGVRDFLIAFNIDLNTTSLEMAKKIAFRLRAIRNDEDMSATYISDITGGLSRNVNLKNFKVIGWRLEELNKVQLSFNLTKPKETPVYLVYELVKRVTREMDMETGASELIGFMPASAIHDIASYISPNQASDKNLTQTVFEYLKIPEMHEPKIINDVF